MADERHFCPECGGIDLIFEDKLISHIRPGAKGATPAKCPNCGWEGVLSETIGAVTKEVFWDIEKISSVLLRVVAKHAAGPFVQVMEFVGLLPRKMSLILFAKSTGRVPSDHTGDVTDEQTIRAWREHETLVEESRDAVLKAMLTGALTAGFEAAERCHRVYAVKTNTPLHSMFRHEEAVDRGEFGGKN